MISETDCAENKGGPKPGINLAHNVLTELLALLRDYRDNEKSEMTEIRQFRTYSQKITKDAKTETEDFLQKLTKQTKVFTEARMAAAKDEGTQ